MYQSMVSVSTVLSPSIGGLLLERRGAFVLWTSAGIAGLASAILLRVLLAWTGAAGQVARNRAAG